MTAQNTDTLEKKVKPSAIIEPEKAVIDEPEKAVIDEPEKAVKAKESDAQRAARLEVEEYERLGEQSLQRFNEQNLTPEGLSMISDWEDPLQAIAERLCPESVPRPLTKADRGKTIPWHDGATTEVVWTGSKEGTKRQYANKGFSPLRENNGSWARENEMIGWRRPIKFRRAQLKIASDKAGERLTSMRSQMQQGLHNDVESGGVGRITENNVTVEKGGD